MSTINTNIDALRASNAYSVGSAKYAKSRERISTNLRINCAKDDPAGLVIAIRLRSKILSYGKAPDSINLGIGVVQFNYKWMFFNSNSLNQALTNTLTYN
jgi:flagellin